MTTVEQVLSWPIGQRGGGWDWYIITVKGKRKQVSSDTWHQRVMLTDGKHEILGCFLLSGKQSFGTSNTPVRIRVCERLELDVNNKMVPAIRVDEWELPTMTADEWEKQNLDIKEEWDKDQDHRIRGMCRPGIVCAMIRASGLREGMPTLNDSCKDNINTWGDYIVTGE